MTGAGAGAEAGAGATRAVGALEATMKARSLWLDVLLRLRRSHSALIGLTVLVLLVIIALVAPFIAPFDPTAMLPGASLQGPSVSHPFGTDQFGRDILSRIMSGSRLSLQLGFISVGIALVFGVLLGLGAGYYGGWVDASISMLMDLMLAFPGILLALSIIAIFGPGLFNLMIAVGIAAIPSYTRLVRGTVFTIKRQTFIEAARVVGGRGPTIMLRHILPNTLAPVIVLATLGIAQAILVGAALSFLGLGAKPPTPEWGAMLSDGRNFLQSAWWITLFPGLAIMVTVLAINLLGDGLRDALDPRLRNR